MSETAHKENKMGVMPMPKLMLSMGLPMIISMIVQAFCSVFDKTYSDTSPRRLSFDFRLLSRQTCVGSDTPWRTCREL